MKNKKNIVTGLVTMVALGGAALAFGLSSCNSDEAIKVYTRDTTSGTRDGFFTTIGMEEAKTDNALLVNGYIEVDGNGTMISSIKNDDKGIGYISLATLEESGLKGLTYEGVIPTEENVLNETYKLTRNFNYCVRSDNDYKDEKTERIVEAFQAYLTTSDAKATIKSKDGILSIGSSDPTWDSIKSQYTICNEDNSNVTIHFGGSTSVEKIAKALSQEFSTLCGNFVAEHNHTGSGDAFKRTQGSEKDGANALEIAFLSRELKSSEACSAGTSGKICTDAIVVVVNKNNSYSSTTAADLVKIYKGEITKWSDLK
ncbi:MAG: substrate-binding domain-containing protein [Anaeroplasmataceae bacterium]